MDSIVEWCIDFLLEWGIVAWIPIAFIGWVIYGVVSLLGMALLNIWEAVSAWREPKREAKPKAKAEAKAAPERKDRKRLTELLRTDEVKVSKEDQRGIRFYWRTFLMLALWMGAFLGSFFGLIGTDSSGNGQEGPWIVAMLGALLVGWVPMVPAMVKDHDSYLDFLIKREYLPPEKVMYSGGGGGYSDSGRGMWATGGYDPERYARQAHEIGIGNIDHVREVYGDFDTYFANRPGD